MRAWRSMGRSSFVGGSGVRLLAAPTSIGSGGANSFGLGSREIGHWGGTKRVPRVKSIAVALDWLGGCNASPLATGEYDNACCGGAATFGAAIGGAGGRSCGGRIAKVGANRGE